MKRIPEAADDGLCLRAHGQSSYSNMQVAGAESTCVIDAPFAQHCIGSGGGGRHRSMGADSGGEDQESASETESSQTASVAFAADASPSEANSGQGADDRGDTAPVSEDASSPLDSAASSGGDAEEELSEDGPGPCQMSGNHDSRENEVPPEPVQSAGVSDTSPDCGNSAPVDGEEERCADSPTSPPLPLHPEADDLESETSPSIQSTFEDDSPASSTADIEEVSSTDQEVDTYSPDLNETGADQGTVEGADDTDAIRTAEVLTSASLEEEEEECSEETTEEKTEFSSPPSTPEEQEEVPLQSEEEQPTVDNCEPAADSSVVDTEEPAAEAVSDAPKSILKTSRSKKNRRRVTFNETMTIYSEEFTTPRQEALRVKEVPEHCRAFDPPLEYQDWEPFEPPAEYRDLEAEIAAIRSSGVSGDTPLVLRSLGAVLFEWFDPCPGSGPSSTQAFPMPHEESEDFVVHYNTNHDLGDDREDCLTPPPGGEENAIELLHEENVIEVSDSVGNTQENAKSAVEGEETSSGTGEEKDDEDGKLASTQPSDEDAEVSPLSFEEQKSAAELFPPFKELAPLGPSGPKPAGESWRLGLNSQHETDSDSSASSQDTMILMTTEESRRNEEHIRDSFRRYESLRRRILGDHGVDSGELRMLSQPDISALLASGDADGDKVVDRSNSVIRRNIEKSAMKRNLAKTTEVRRRQRTGISRPKSPTPLQDSLVEKLRWLTDTENSSSSSADNSEAAPPDEKDGTSGGSGQFLLTPPSSKPKEGSNKSGSLQRRISPGARPSSFERSLDTPASTSSRERALATMAIPQDVREWKISPGLTNRNSGPWKMSPDLVPDKNSRPLADHVVRRSTSAEHLPASFLTKKGSGQDTSLTAPEDNDKGNSRGKVTVQQYETSDELEQFVEQYLERIERIRKRYSLTEEAELSLGFVRRPSVRGIRPRFGSTTEILKQMQSQIQPPPLASPSCARSHVTWPYVDVGDLMSQQRVFQGSHYHHHHYHPHRASMLARVLEDEPSGVQKQGPRSNRQTEDVSGPSSSDAPPLVPVCSSASANAPPLLPGGAHIRTKKNKTVAPGGCASSMSNQKFPTSAAISCPVTKDERGAPEGASSSPKVSSDSLYHQGGLNQAPPALDSPSKEGFIYYSLKV